MKIDRSKKNGMINVSFELTGDKWADFIKKAKIKVTENLEVKGFRKGKVPINIAKTHISREKVRTEAMNMAIDKHWNDIFEEVKKENIISRPELLLNKITDEELSVVFSFVLCPEIKIGNISGIKVKLEKAELTKEEIEQQLASLRQFMVGAKEVERSIEKNDIVNIDFIGKHNEKEFEGGKAKRFDLKIGSKSFVDNFEDQLIGLKKGDEKLIEVSFPKEYPSEELAGQKVQFDVKINSVKLEAELIGKELEDKLKSFGFKSKKDLEEKAISLIKSQKIQQNKDKFFEGYVKEIVDLKDTNIIIPDILLKKELEKEYTQFEKNLVQKDMKMNDYLKMLKLTEEEFKEKNLTEKVKENIIKGLVYQELLKKNKIEVTDEDYENEYKKIVEQQGLELEQVKKDMHQEEFTNAITYSKLIDKISK